jgi:methylase of polypeptide subunit release factors
MEVLESHLYSAVAGRTFDLICFNIPFYPKPPESPLEHAFNAGRDFETVRAFAADTPPHLADGGVVTVIFSEDSGYDRIVSFFTAAGLERTETRSRRKHFEDFFIVSFRRPAGRRLRTLARTES